MPTARKHQVCLDTTPFYHCVSRCVRRAYLCGKDQATNQCYDHRRDWIEHRMLFLASVFCVEICAYAVMSNHTHLVIRVDKHMALSLSDREVVTRWHKLCKGTLVTRTYEKEGGVEDYQESTLKETIAIYRNRLFDLSWFMRLLNEPIARMANSEDGCTGRFWEGRFSCQALLDEKAVTACMAYVDLNPIRAGIAKSLEESKHTSIYQRLKFRTGNHQPPFLMTFKENGTRVSSRGNMFELDEYLQLVDMTGRTIGRNGSGYLDDRLPELIGKLNISSKNWLSIIQSFETYFRGAVGCSESLRYFCNMNNRVRRPNLINALRYFK